MEVSMKKIAFIIIALVVFLGVVGCEDLTNLTLPPDFTTTTTATESSTTDTESTTSIVTITNVTTTAPLSTSSDTSGGETTGVVTTTPVTTAPVSSSDQTTAPITTAPITTAPVTTLPATTVPETTAPVTTVPVTTAPVTTVPMTTVPTTTTETTETETTQNFLSVSFYVGEDLYHQENVPVGYSVSAPEEPTLAGHIFLGWILVGGSTVATFPAQVNENLVFVASFEEEVLNVVNHFFVRSTNMTAETLVVEVVLGGDEIKVNGYDIRINYDDTFLEYSSHVNNVANYTNPNDSGVILFNYSEPMTAFTDEIVVLTITFDILQSGSTAIQLTVIEAFVVDESFNITVTTTNASGLDIEIS